MSQEANARRISDGLTAKRELQDERTAAAQRKAIANQLREQHERRELTEAATLAAVLLHKLAATEPGALHRAMDELRTTPGEFTAAMIALARDGGLCLQCLTSQAQCTRHGELASHCHA